MRISDDRRIRVTAASGANRTPVFRVARERVIALGAIAFVGDGIAGIVNTTPDGFSAWINDCPHWGMPLDANTPDLLSAERDRLMCSVHGATFTLDTGLCDGGPCAGSRLTPLELDFEHDEIVVFAPAPITIAPRAE